MTCTESPDDNNNNNNKGNKRAAVEVSELMSKLMNVLESRNDVNANDNISVHALPTLSKVKATSLAESSLRHLLGGETSEAHLAYRGDKHLAEEPMVQLALC